MHLLIEWKLIEAFLAHVVICTNYVFTRIINPTAVLMKRLETLSAQ